MIYRFIIISLVVLLSLANFTTLNAQETKPPKQSQELAPLTKYDSIGLMSLPKLTLPEEYKGPSAKLLPLVVDNTENQYWRPNYAQVGMECGQASSIGMGFTYELNRLRDLPSDVTENQQATHFVWNFANGGDGYYGVSYFHSFEITKFIGNPDVTTYGGSNSTGGSGRWMSGYDNYLASMKNRLNEAYQIDVSTEEGIQTAKAWIYDHHEGSEIGGVANFYANAPYSMPTLPSGTPEAGKYVVTSWGGANHAMTIGGYNDEICYDYNNDGQYTNTIDINNDGEVNVRDWEIGGFKFNNTYSGGPSWGNSGFCYMTYKGCADPSGNGGIWNNSLHVQFAKEYTEPQLTAKVSLKHIARGMIRVKVGVSTDQNSETPQYVLGFPILNYQGANYYMQGGQELEENKTIEFGLDLTPLINIIGPGTPARYFLLIDEDDPTGWGVGEIVQFSIIDYTDGVVEIDCGQNNVNLNNNSLTKLWVDHTVDFATVMIDMDTLPPATVYEPYSAQLQATGGKYPYYWSLDLNYAESNGTETFPMANDEELNPGSNYATKQLGFDFPFFGETYDYVRVYQDGYIMFESEFGWPYEVYDFLKFSKNKYIAPFMADLTFEGEDGLWYEGDDNSAIFRWKASQEGNSSESEINFAVELKENGDIKFYYGPVNDFTNLEWISGTSAGDNKYYQFTNVSGHPTITPNYICDLEVSEFPEGFQISHDGELSGTPYVIYDDYEMKFQVYDDNNIKDSKVLYFSTDGSNYLVIDDYTVIAGDDDIIEVGETVYLSVDIKNLGENVITGSEMKISIAESVITLIDSTEVLGVFQPDEVKSYTSAFTFSVDEYIQNEYTIDISTIILDDAGSDWNSHIYLTIYSAELYVGYASIDDGGNGSLDPGETADLLVQMLNVGGATATEVNSIVSSNDPFITINENIAFLEMIEGNSTEQLSFNITASPDTPIGHTVDFNIDYTAGGGLNGNDDVSIVVGQIPVLIIDLDPNSSSAPSMEEALGELGVTFETWMNLPPDVNMYSSIFLCLGIYSDNHVLSSDEGQTLANYLGNSGKLYMEGGDTWAYDSQTAVHAMFNVNGVADGSGDMSTVDGQDGTFTEGMSFSYTGENNWMDQLEPIGNAFLILENQSPEYGTAIAYQEGNYSTIGASHEFGGLSDGTEPSTKAVLMEKYLEFFGILSLDLIANFTASQSQFCSGESVEFLDISSGSINSWQWTFEGGEPETSNLQYPEVTYNTPGIYDVSLVISDGVNSDTINKQNYIVVYAYPDSPATPNGADEVCTNETDYTEYITAGGSFIDSYVWKLLPEEAGLVSGDGTIGTVEWTENWEGTATLKVRGINNNCGEGEFSDAFEILCEICTGIKSQASISDIHIFPNPTTGELFLESKAGLKNTILTIINPLNQIVYNKQVDFTNQPLLKINLEGKAEGVYYLHLKSDKKERIEKIILK
ncbi:PKD domain-containing protein [Desulfosarcina sp.]|nr:PKD domain-containing protein [Desulfosarcina sp.]